LLVQLLILGIDDGVALDVDVLQVGDAVLQCCLHLRGLGLWGHGRPSLQDRYWISLSGNAVNILAETFDLLADLGAEEHGSVNTVHWLELAFLSHGWDAVGMHGSHGHNNWHLHGCLCLECKILCHRCLFSLDCFY